MVLGRLRISDPLRAVVRMSTWRDLKLDLQPPAFHAAREGDVEALLDFFLSNPRANVNGQDKVRSPVLTNSEINRDPLCFQRCNPFYLLLEYLLDLLHSNRFLRGDHAPRGVVETIVEAR
jgi:hypothetical protein